MGVKVSRLAHFSDLERVQYQMLRSLKDGHWVNPSYGRELLSVVMESLWDAVLDKSSSVGDNTPLQQALIRLEALEGLPPKGAVSEIGCCTQKRMSQGLEQRVKNLRILLRHREGCNCIQGEYVNHVVNPHYGRRLLKAIIDLIEGAFEVVPLEANEQFRRGMRQIRELKSPEREESIPADPIMEAIRRDSHPCDIGAQDLVEDLIGWLRRKNHQDLYRRLCDLAEVTGGGNDWAKQVRDAELEGARLKDLRDGLITQIETALSQAEAQLQQLEEIRGLQDPEMWTDLLEGQYNWLEEQMSVLREALDQLSGPSWYLESQVSKVENVVAEVSLGTINRMTPNSFRHDPEVLADSKTLLSMSP
jgi:hypothetical protein